MLSKLNLRKRMFLFIIGANLIVLIAISFIFLNFSKNLLVRETQEKSMEKVKNEVNKLQAYIIERSQIGWTLCQSPMIVDWLDKNTIRKPDRKQDPTYGKIKNYLKLLVRKSDKIISAFIASEKTQMYYENFDREIPDDYMVGKRQWYIDAIKDKKPVYDFTYDYLNKSLPLSCRHNIYNENGELLGVGGVDISLDNFKNYISNLQKIFNTGQAFMIDKEGTFLYHPNPSYILERKITDFANDGSLYKHMNQASLRLIEEKEGIEEVVFAGEKRYFIHTEIPSLGWTVVLSVATQEINQPIHTLIFYSVLIILAASLLFIVIIHFLVRSISHPLSNLVAMLKSVAKGEADLTRRLEVNSKDEIGQLAHWFNEFIKNLHDLIVNVRDNVNEIVEASAHLQKTTEHMDKGALDQSNTTSNIASSTREMSTTINETSRIYNQAVEVVRKASNKARDGEVIVKRSATGMKKIADSVENSQETISNLDSRSTEIGKIIQVIDEIAVQTNLLALNARIEAAGAGEEGKGFAVVAEDISKLAERTSEATKEISKLIKSIQSDVSRVVESMESGIEEVEEGTGLVNDSGQVLSKILLNVEEIQRVISELSQASEQMTLASEEINKNTTSIDSITSDNVKSTKNLSEIAGQLNEKADALNEKINRFTL